METRDHSEFPGRDPSITPSELAMLDSNNRPHIDPPDPVDMTGLL